MSTNFPTGLDTLVNPVDPPDTLASVPHDAQHANANDAIEALEAKVGVNGSAVATSLDFKVAANTTNITTANNTANTALANAATAQSAANAAQSTANTALAGAGLWTRDAGNTWVYNTNYTTDDFIAGSNQMDDAGGTDRDFRMFFNKTKGAFRAGTTTDTQWNDANVGTGSVAFGSNCTASGANSLAAGDTSTASGARAVALGIGSEASGGYSIAVGSSNIASNFGCAAIGQFNVASDVYAFASGRGAAASRFGQVARASISFAVAGDCQSNKFVAGRTTTNATGAVLLFENAQVVGSVNLTGSNMNVLTIPVSRAHKVTVNAIARRTDSTSDAGGWKIEGTIVRGASGSAAFISTPTSTADLTAGASAWTLVATIDTSDATNNYLKLTATGQSGATIRWVADIQTVEVG